MSSATDGAGGRPAPREIDARRKAFAFETACGYPPAEACRRAGGKVENGHATKWLAQKRVQEWIAWYRGLGNTEEMLAAKRARIEARLNAAAFGDIFEFVTLTERTKSPMIDWEKVMASPLAPTIAGFKFDRETGMLVDFERDNALQALAQLRDMHGFKGPTKVEHAGALDIRRIELVAAGVDDADPAAA